MAFALFSDGKGNGLKMASVLHAKVPNTAWVPSGGNQNSLDMCVTATKD